MIFRKLKNVLGVRSDKPDDQASAPPIPYDQVWTTRRPHMENLIRNSFDYPIHALEIGTWFGIGSTQIWLENLKPGSTLTLLDAWRSYSSEIDLRDKQWGYGQADQMCSEAFLSTFLNAREFEINKRDSNVSIHIVRADSELFLPFLAQKSFDFIYIDGDHKYAKVKSDIQQAKRLVRGKFGIVCGDDLEKLPTKELMELAKNHKNQDFLRAPHYFHPGVLLAVAEEFERIHMSDGFWWVFSRNGNFTAEPAAV